MAVPPRHPATPPGGRRWRPGPRGLFVVAGLMVALALAALATPLASSQPDGLARVAAEHAIDSGAGPHALGDGPLAEYGVDGVDDPALATRLAGVLGVLVTFAVGGGLIALVRRRRPSRPRPD